MIRHQYQQCDHTNSCIYKICHTAPGDERPLDAETFCGILSQVMCERKIKGTSSTCQEETLPPTHLSGLWYHSGTWAWRDVTDDGEKQR